MLARPFARMEVAEIGSEMRVVVMFGWRGAFVAPSATDSGGSVVGAASRRPAGIIYLNEYVILYNFLTLIL